MKALFTEEQRVALVEATYTADAAARSEASRVWDSIIAYVQAQEAVDFHGLVRDPYRRSGGYVVYSHSTELPHDLRVILAPKGVQSLLSSLRSGGFIIYIGDVLMGPRDPTHLVTRIGSQSFRKKFVHEFTHYLDQKRNPALFRSGSRAAKASHAGHAAAYLRTPEEFNAWFQHTAQEIESSVDVRIASARHMMKIGRRGPDMAEMKIDHLKQEFATFRSFLHMVSLESPESNDVVKHLKGSKWERKWTKRMHGLYRGLKPKVQEITL